MIRSPLQGLAAIILSVSIVLLSGCGQSKPTRFYVLHSMLGAHAPVQGATDGGDVVIGVGPVKIPDYLDRPQMITRKGQSSLELAEFDKWAEPLDKNLTRAIGENLSVLLGTENVASFPWPKATKARYQVTVDIIRLDSVPGGKVILEARWTILDDSGEKALVTKKSYIETPISAGGYDGIALAMSTATEALSREIASAIGSLQRGQPAN